MSTSHAAMKQLYHAWHNCDAFADRLLPPPRRARLRRPRGPGELHPPRPRRGAGLAHRAAVRGRPGPLRRLPRPARLSARRLLRLRAARHPRRAGGGGGVRASALRHRRGRGRALFHGIAPAVVALIVKACWSLGKKTIGKDLRAWTFFVAACTITIALQRELAPLFIVAGLLGIVVFSGKKLPVLAVNVQL